MLRLLHTADWHLGHTLHGLDRAREHRAFLAWLRQILADERVDALLVAGDVFDAANPPASAVTLWYGFLAEAWRRLPGLQIVVVGGNHDSAARLDAPHPLLRALGRLHVVGGLPRRADGAGLDLDLDRLVVPLTDAGGREAALVAAVPYLRPGDLPGPADAEDAAAAALRAAYGEVLAAARARAGRGQALVAMGHLHLAGGQVSDLSERRVLGGNLHAVSDDLFPADVAYAALGHLHLAQRVGAREHVRYAGSPIPLSFDERHYPHQAVLVELDGDRAAAIRAVRVPRERELLRVPEGEPRPLPEVAAALAALPPAGPGGPPEEAWPWVEARVELPAPEPGLRAALEAAMKGRAARLARIAPPRYTGTGAPLAEAAPDRTLADLGPEEVFLRKWERDHGAAPPPEVRAAFAELLDALFRRERDEAA